MTVAQFKQELEAFIEALSKHQGAWRRSQGWRISDTQKQGLELQAHQLGRQLGRLRPYILRFEPQPVWIMQVAATGTRWDALDAAVGTHEIPQVKGPSMQAVVDKLNQLLGRLDGLNPADELGQPAVARTQSPKIPDKSPQTTPTSPPKPPASSPKPPATIPEPPAAPPRVTSPTTSEPPVTLDKISVGDFLWAFRRLSVGALLTLLGILGAIITATVAVTRWTDQRAIEVTRDSVRLQQRVIDAERRRIDSLTALSPPTRKAP